MEVIAVGAKWLGVIFFIVAIVIEISDFDGIFSAIVNVTKNTILGVIIGAVLGFVVGLILSVYVLAKNDITKSVEPLYPRIESLQDNSSLKGDFFIGSGNIDGTMKYAFYIREKDPFTNEDSFRLVLLDYKDTSIVYSDERPRVDVVKNHWRETWQFKYSLLKKTYVDRYIIYVPRGTIKNNFTLDAQ